MEAHISPRHNCDVRIDVLFLRERSASIADEINNLALQQPRAIRADISEIRFKVDELARSYARLLKIAASQGDAIVWLNRRVERSEKRLDLVGA
jgi:hypothetical protein